MNFPQLHQAVTLLIPGKSRTGKSELAKFLCMRFAIQYQSFDVVKVALVNTLDTLCNNQSIMLPGVLVLLDVFDSGDDKESQLKKTGCLFFSFDNYKVFQLTRN